MSELAPIVIFTYNRLQEIRRTIDALQKNHLAGQSNVYIFSDGAKNLGDAEKVTAVREYLKTIEGFEKITITEAKSNMGLANSIIAGVSKVFENYDKIIVLEDDLVSSKNFLDFINQALDFYDSSEEIISVSGYTRDLPILQNYKKDYYLGYRASSLGWGTWKSRWTQVDWEVADYLEFRSNKKLKRRMARIGSDMPGMLKNQQEGVIDSWAIRWCYHQFKYDLKCVFASTSKLNHIGIDNNATNASNELQFSTPLDIGDKTQFHFDLRPKVDSQLVKEFRSAYSIKSRTRNRLRKIVKKTFG